VIGPIQTGAQGNGYWQNKNGQGIIQSSASTAGVCNLTTWLRQYSPFNDLSASASCDAAAAYVANTIKSANASGPTMNSMLKAQMLSTALDVYFSDATLGGNRLGAPQPIGGVVINLGTNSAAFGGAVSMSVSQMLSYASSQSNAGGSVWYGNVKSTQQLASNA